MKLIIWIKNANVFSILALNRFINQHNFLNSSSGSLCKFSFFDEKCIYFNDLDLTRKHFVGACELAHQLLRMSPPPMITGATSALYYGCYLKLAFDTLSYKISFEVQPSAYEKFYKVALKKDLAEFGDVVIQEVDKRDRRDKLLRPPSILRRPIRHTTIKQLVDHRWYKAKKYMLYDKKQNPSPLPVDNEAIHVVKFCLYVLADKVLERNEFKHPVITINKQESFRDFLYGR